MVKKCLGVLLLSSFSCFAFSPSVEEAYWIGEKIWKNECAATIEGLTHWHQKEPFPSLGIGHFMWYPVGQSGPFEETFPLLLYFLQEQGVALPEWLLQAQGCPWKSREEFYQNSRAPKMVALRQLLFETRQLQAIFMAQRLKTTLAQMKSALSEKEWQCVNQTAHKIARDPKGLYALIDYLNFKGSGLSPKERYRGAGWGLLQVLQRCVSSQNVEGFARAAQEVLEERVRNSPLEKREEQWLKGWKHRVHSYLEQM